MEKKEKLEQIKCLLKGTGIVLGSGLLLSGLGKLLIDFREETKKFENARIISEPKRVNNYWTIIKNKKDDSKKNYIEIYKVELENGKRVWIETPEKGLPDSTNFVSGILRKNDLYGKMQGKQVYCNSSVNRFNQ